jgi:peptidoglycan hydrolase-like protein with peptidoglycan-binding domain
VLQDDETRKVFRDAVLNPSETLDDHMSSIAAALAVTEEDVGRIREHAKGMDGANVQLDLKTLSTLYRYATLAKALEIRVRDLITMLRLVPDSMNPFSPGDPGSALDFVRTVRSVEVSGFSIPLLNYLFRDEAEPTRHPAPTRILVKRTLETLQKGLAAIHQEMQVAEQPPADILRSRLELAAPMLALEVPKGIDQALAVLDPRVTEFAGKVLALQDRTTFVNDHFTTFLPTPGQVLFGTPLPASADLQDKAKRFVDNVIKVRDALIPWLRRQLEERLVFETMANAVGKDQTIVQRLLRNVLLAWTGMPQPSTALEYFLSLVNQQGIATDMDLDEDPPKPPALEFVRTFTRVFKAAAYTGSFDMTESELRLFTSPPSPLPTFDPGAGLAFELNELPLEAVAPSSAAPGKLFEVWGALQSFFTLRDSLPRTEKTLVDYFEASDKATRQKILAEAAGWDDKQIIAVATSMGLPNLPLTTPDLIRFHRGMELLKRVGATPAHMFAWAANIPDHAQADDIVQTVKARYERARWLEVARGLNDPLREKQRNALVALLLGRYAPIAILEQPHPELKKGANRPAVFELQRKLNAALPGAPPLLVDGIFSQNTYATVVLFQSTRGLATDGIVGPFTWSALDQVGPPLKDSSDLFDYFLIDVEMSSCMLTSRVKQAISSVQLFVQRCLLNLEPAVSPEEIDVDRWEWMKHYRIWEANRKVFLYPETYILPELRDDKTPFFRELETDLLQNELTEKTIETAFVSYLCKLDEVARLDIRGFCKEDEDGKETYHLFGRTWNRPYVYYYRCGTFTVDSGQGEWSPWERLDLNIEGDHLVPMVYNRRLHLFWVVFEEEADKDAATPKVEGQEPAVKWAVKATWSQNVGGKWTPSFSARERLSAYPQTSIVDGKTRYQLHDTWRYRVSASVDDESLSLVIRRSWSPEFLSGHKAGNRSGAFVLVGCHKGLSAVGGNEKAEAEWLFYGPDHSVIRGMALESNNNTLYLPAVTATPIFDQIPEKFWVLPPSTLDVASSQEWFPFCFTDTELNYFARPIVETIGAHAASAETTFNEVVHLEHVSFKEALGPDLVFDLMLAAGDGHG